MPVNRKIPATVAVLEIGCLAMRRLTGAIARRLGCRARGATSDQYHMRMVRDPAGGIAESLRCSRVSRDLLGDDRLQDRARCVHYWLGLEARRSQRSAEGGRRPAW